MKELVKKLINKIKRYAKNVKKAWRKLKYLDKTQLSYYIVTSFIGAFCVFTGGTYAVFTVTTYASAGNITTAKLSYNLTINSCNYITGSTTCTYNNNTGNAYPTVTVPANQTVVVELTLTSQNNNYSGYTTRTFNTKYAIMQSKVNTGITNYTSSDNLSVYYSQNNQNNTIGAIGPTGSSITPIRIVIKNTNSSSKTVYLTVIGGYTPNKIESNIIEGYYEQDITLRTTLLNYDFSVNSTPSTFPVNDGSNTYAYFRTVCSEDVIANWDNDNWTLTVSSGDQVACDVYFKKMCNDGTCNDVEIVYHTTDEQGNESVSYTSPDDTYSFVDYTCNTDAKLSTPTWSSVRGAWNINVSNIKGVTLCTAYFEKTPTYLSDYIISTYGTDTALYYHTTDSTKWQNGESTYSSYVAGDNSYRYSGADADVHNYVCFGTDNENTCLNDTSNHGASKYLYRIIGVFNDGQGYRAKLVLAYLLFNSKTSAVGYRWDYNGSSRSNEWANASLKQWLNGETLESGATQYYPDNSFLSNYTSTWTNKIAPSTWYVRGFVPSTITAKDLYTEEIYNVKNSVSGYTTNYQGNSPILTNTKIGLMYMSDYRYASLPSTWSTTTPSTNWLTLDAFLWTISPRNSNDHYVWSVARTGDLYDSNPDSQFLLRPVFSLSSNTKINTTTAIGDGSASNPYMLKAK